MKTRTKVILGIFALCVIGSFWGKDGKTKEKQEDNAPHDLIVVENEQNKEEAPAIEVEYDSQAGEALVNEPLIKNVEEEQISVDIPADNETDVSSNPLEVHFIDVGQGDSTLIKCGDEAMLVDAGDEGKGTAVQLYLKKQGVSDLKYVVATHPDADHIGGLDVIIYKYDCGQILIPNCSNDTPSFDQLKNLINAKGYSPHVVDIGEKYTLGDAEFEILSPSSEFMFSDTNDSSIVFRLDHGDNSFLFTGDATIPPQQALIYDPDLDIDVDVVKVPHHGAATAYIKGFYDEVSPEYAVISCGKDNSYGHPRQEVLNDLRSRNTKVFRTDEQGTIVATSDGKTITFDTAPSDSWLSREVVSLGEPEEDITAPITRGFQHNLSESPEAGITYVYNSNTTKFHLPSCSSVTDMKPKNRVDLSCSREELLNMYPDAKPCKRCNP